MSRTLLEIAKTNSNIVRIRHPEVSDELIELAYAWATDEISTVAVAEALGKKLPGGNIYLPLAKALREYIRRSKQSS